MTKINTELEGIKAVMKPYLAELLKEMWRRERSSRKRGWNSGEAHKFALENGLTAKGFNPDARSTSVASLTFKRGRPKPISRASVIFGLNDLVDEGILDFYDRTGKGGHHRVYYPKLSPEEFEVYIRIKVKTAFNESIFPSNWVKAVLEGER